MQAGKVHMAEQLALQYVAVHSHSDAAKQIRAQTNGMHCDDKAMPTHLRS